MPRRTKEKTIRIVFINTYARPFTTIAAPLSLPTATATVNVEPYRGLTNEIVTIEVDGQKLEGRIVNVNENNLFFLDTEGKLHIIPLKKLLKEKPQIKVFA